MGVGDVVVFGDGVRAEILDRGERDRVHEDVEPIPSTVDLGDERCDVLRLGRVAEQYRHVLVIRQRFDQLGDVVLETIVEIREREPGALALEAGSDPPGDAPLISNANDERALSLEQPHAGHLRVPRIISEPKWRRTAI